MGVRFFVTLIAALICSQVAHGDNSTTGSNTTGTTNTTSGSTTTNGTVTLTPLNIYLDVTAQGTYNLASGAEVHFMQNSNKSLFAYVQIPAQNNTVTVSMPTFSAALYAAQAAQNKLAYMSRVMQFVFGSSVTGLELTLAFNSTASTLGASKFYNGTQSWMNYNSSSQWDSFTSMNVQVDTDKLLSATKSVSGSTINFAVLADGNTTGTVQSISNTSTATFTLDAGQQMPVSITAADGSQLATIGNLNMAAGGGSVAVKIYQDTTGTAAKAVVTGNKILSKIIDIVLTGSLTEKAVLQFDIDAADYTPTLAYGWMTLSVTDATTGKSAWITLDGSESSVTGPKNGKYTVTTKVPHFSPWAVQSSPQTTVTTTAATTTVAPKVSGGFAIAPLSALLAMLAAAFL